MIAQSIIGLIRVINSRSKSRSSAVQEDAQKARLHNSTVVFNEVAVKFLAAEMNLQYPHFNFIFSFDVRNVGYLTKSVPWFKSENTAYFFTHKRLSLYFWKTAENQSQESPTEIVCKTMNKTRRKLGKKIRLRRIFILTSESVAWSSASGAKRSEFDIA